MIVAQILKSKGDGGVVTLPPSATVSDAAQILSTRKIGTVVISKDGETADGILSERDIVRDLGRRGPACMAECVDTLMTAKVVSCAPSANADSVLAQMTAGRFRHMPVVEADRLVGLISLGDVVKAKLAEVQMEKDALQGMIMGH